MLVEAVQYSSQDTAWWGPDLPGLPLACPFLSTEPIILWFENPKLDRIITYLDLQNGGRGGKARSAVQLGSYPARAVGMPYRQCRARLAWTEDDREMQTKGADLLFIALVHCGRLDQRACLNGLPFEAAREHNENLAHIVEPHYCYRTLREDLRASHAPLFAELTEVLEAGQRPAATHVRLPLKS